MANTKIKSNNQILTQEVKMNLLIESILDDLDLERIESEIFEPVTNAIINDRNLI